MPHRKIRAKARRARKAGSKLHLALAQSIGEGILNGTYAPGTLLPNEAEWSAVFGASRTAVREAIKTLNGKGLLVSRPKIGSRVVAREHWNLLDRDVLAWHCAAMDRMSLLQSIQEVRRILEPGAAALAATRRSEAQLRRMAEALDGMRQAQSADATVAPDVEFHLALLHAANNDLLMPFGIIIEQALNQMFAYTSRHHPRPRVVIPLHEAVYDAVARADPAAASRAMLDILNDTDAVVAETAEARPAGTTSGKDRDI